MWAGMEEGGARTKEESSKQAGEGKSGTLFCKMCAGDGWVVNVRAVECGRRKTHSGKMVLVNQPGCCALLNGTGGALSGLLEV